MRHGYFLLIAVGCGFESTRVAPDSAGLVPGTWSLAGANQLAAPGHVAVDMTIEARGALTPAAYTYGGLTAHGLMNAKLWTHGDVSWAYVDPTMASGAGLWRGDAIDTGGALDYLGIPMKPMKVTLWFEGEVWLEAGANEQFGLHGNDVAFIDIANPGTTRYTPLMESDATMPVAVPVTGWYPIRIGFSDGDGNGDFTFSHADAGGPLVPWTRDRLRARASELQGTFRTVFGRQILGGGVGPTQLPTSHFEQIDLLKAMDFDATPQGVGPDDWSARYAGQVYIAEPGEYALQITSDDGNRGRLGAAVKLTGWSRGFGVGDNPAMTTVNATLAAGWNDIILDYNEVSGMRAMSAAIKGPGFSDGPVPRALLRPVESADDRLATGGEDTRRDVPDNGGAGDPATAVVKIAGFPGETVAAIDVTYEIDSHHWNQIRVDLEAPAATVGPGVRRVIRDRDNQDADENRILQQTIAAGAGDLAPLLGGPSGGDWKLHVYDDDPGGPGINTSLKSAKITLHITGGPERIAKTASWTSAVLDAATRVRAIDGVTWNQRLPDGAGLELRVGTCQQADCSDGPAWSPSVTPSTAFDVAAGRYLQVRVDMTSNGVVEPELRSLAVMYHRDSD